MSWAVHTAIRSRREQIGFSQADLAQAMGINKSLLSHIESGNRQPTDEQVAKLSTLLGLPPDLLLLVAGRMPEDVRDAFQTKTAEAVAAVRQRTEAQAVLYPKFPSIVPHPNEKIVSVQNTYLPERIEVSKTSTSYRAHSYHTKVPPEAITPFIRAFTYPGDTVLDPFCGSGMTGVAALMENRNAFLSDLSPAAVHIARNYTNFCDPNHFAEAFARVQAIIEPTITWLYRPIGSDCIVEYTTWSDVYRCPACRREIIYWELVKSAHGINGDRIVCPHCGNENRKASMEWVGDIPVESHTSQGSNRINTHSVTREEMALIEEAEAAPIPYWTPAVVFGPEREMWRAAHRAMGINDVAGFFTRRNLHGLAALRHAIVSQSEGRVREALLFAFTAAVNRASKRYQWNAKRPTNVMTGTLYISSLRYEWNIWSLFRRKASDVLRYYRSFPNTSATVDVFQRSATSLDCLPDNSIDMVFMDPPFGSNIFYADSSLLWDSWLGDLTDEAAEIVINKHRTHAAGGKNLEDYGDLLCQSFEHAGRVLKSGGRAILAFSNSDDQVWMTVQNALKNAGFETASVHILNKGQPSIKGVKGVTGKENVTTLDLLLCLEHTRTAHRPALFPPPNTLIDKVIHDAVGKGDERTDGIYSAVIRAAIEARYSVTGITMPIIAKRCIELGACEINGIWKMASATIPTTVKKDFIAGYLADADGLPRSRGNPAIGKALPKVRVSGGRNSAFYIAHSYHTKVPPEAITPFIEHYTKPGDVVLDPFCGSGMTGVAAVLAGRRAILNDLSTAAIHLAWNHTRPCDPDALVAGFSAVEERVAKRLQTLYETKHTDGTSAVIHWTIWSTRYTCPTCDHSFLLWDVIDRSSGRLGSKIDCPNCNSNLLRSELKKRGSEPAWLAYETKDGKRHEKAATQEDINFALSHRREAIEAWYPSIPIGADREMYIRCALHLQGIESIADFYTSRNLEALALLWQEIMAVADERVRRVLAFAFTNTAWHGTRMRRFNARGGQRPLTGTLYIPQLSSEANVLEVMRNKIKQLQRYYRNYHPQEVELPSLILGSATDLSRIPDGSIDYVFTDPPFGSNIFYSDCNLIWESWLGRITESTSEAVVNRSLKDGKSLATYAALIGGAMREIARVLKPEGWATVVFHNTDGAVWQAIRDAAEQAGFRFHEAASLDRQQQSHKGYKGRSGAEDVAHFDVVFNLQKVNVIAEMSTSQPRNGSLNLSSLIETVMKDPAITRHGLQGVHAEVMRRMASDGSNDFVDYAAVRSIWERLANQDQ